MYGGRIVKNQCAHYGGGLRLEKGTVDVRAGVLIAGSGHTEANYAGSGGHAYCRYGPKPYNPTITFAFTDYK
jgi:hypothetical protein